MDHPKEGLPSPILRRSYEGFYDRPPANPQCIAENMITLQQAGVARVIVGITHPRDIQEVIQFAETAGSAPLHYNMLDSSKSTADTAGQPDDMTETTQSVTFTIVGEQMHELDVVEDLADVIDDADIHVIDSSGRVKVVTVPPSLDEKYIPAYKDIALSVALDNRFIGMYAAGSVIRGEGAEHSDLDFIILTDDTLNYSQRHQDTARGVFFEAFIYSPQELLDSFAKGDYQDMHMVGYGYNSFGDNAKLNPLKEYARELFESGPGSANKESIDYKKYLLWDSYADIKDVLATSPLLAKSLMHESMWSALKVFYDEKAIWFPKKKRLMESLSIDDMALSEKVTNFLSKENPQEAIIEYREMIQYIIGDRSIDQPYAWRSHPSIGGVALNLSAEVPHSER